MKKRKFLEELDRYKYKFEEGVLWYFKVSNFSAYFTYLGEAGAKNERIIFKEISKYILSDYFAIPVEDIHILYSEKGKPYIDKDNVYFSISHSSGYFAILVSNTYNVGVDIQKMKKCALYPEMILSKEEKEMMNTLKKEEYCYFYWRIWTLKEALSKLFGDGMTVSFAEIRKETDDFTDLAGQYRYPNNKCIDIKVYELNYETYHLCSVFECNEQNDL